MCEKQLSDSSLLVFANKQDLSLSKDTQHVSQKLGLNLLKQSCHIEACVCTTGDGLYEGLVWLCRNIPRCISKTISFRENTIPSLVDLSCASVAVLTHKQITEAKLPTELKHKLETDQKRCCRSWCSAYIYGEAMATEISFIARKEGAKPSPHLRYFCREHSPSNT
eukprot:TRINITY_DN21005_c0_g1_i1.p1 TRINITY_DN21005_c0_g1~~TRINITY_DN21005_c0_g1_i1.p1  ORF type:complete len:166 (+),score=5.87 TRINITY_DN21005_c0_g1_i1:177-674(+)